MTRRLEPEGLATSPAKRPRSACFPALTQQGGAGASASALLRRPHAPAPSRPLDTPCSSSNSDGGSNLGGARAVGSGGADAAGPGRKRRSSATDLGSCETIFKKLSIRSSSPFMSASSPSTSSLLPGSTFGEVRGGADQLGTAAAPTHMDDGSAAHTLGDGAPVSAAVPGKGKVEDVSVTDQGPPTTAGALTLHQQHDTGRWCRTWLRSKPPSAASPSSSSS
jgi:hypothetical protein